jgi:hypothetical protein
MYNETISDHFCNTGHARELPQASGVGTIGNGIRDISYCIIGAPWQSQAAA